VFENRQWVTVVTRVGLRQISTTPLNCPIPKTLPFRDLRPFAFEWNTNWIGHYDWIKSRIKLAVYTTVRRSWFPFYVFSLCSAVVQAKEMCGTTDSSFQSSNTLNNTDIWSLIELASLCTVALSVVNGLSYLTTSSNGQERLIQPITFESSQNGRFKFESNLEALQVPILLLIQTSCFNL